MRQFPAMVGLLAPIAVAAGACGATGPRHVAAAPTASAIPPPADVSTSSSAAAAPSATVIAMIAPPPPPNPGSTKVTSRTDPTWATCHRGRVAKDTDVVRDVAAMAAGCAKATKMQLVGKTLTGNQGDQDQPQSFPMQAEANHCYRVYARAAEGVRNLQVVIKDSTGAAAGDDSTDGGSPVIAEDGAVCFKESDAATIVVSVGMGKGAYALQVWRD